MGQVENPSLAIIELADQQHQSDHDERDIAGADQNLAIRIPRHRATQPYKKIIRSLQMLDYVHEQRVIVFFETDGRQSLVEIMRIKRIKNTGSRSKRIDSSHAALLVLLEDRSH